MPDRLEKTAPGTGFILLAEFLLQFVYNEPRDLFMVLLRCYQHNGSGLQSFRLPGVESWPCHLPWDPGLVTESLCLSFHVYEMKIITVSTLWGYEG